MNADEFRAACTTQIRFMTKLAVIASKPYLVQIRMVDIRRAIDEHRLPVEVVQNNGQEMLVFDPGGDGLNRTSPPLLGKGGCKNLGTAPL